MVNIKAENLSKQYGTDDATVHAVRDISLNIAPGEFIAIMGESGSGKSTLLSMMGALNTPTSGSYNVAELDVYGLGIDQRADFRREFIGFVFQSFQLVTYLTVLENVMLPLATTKRSRAEKVAMANAALEKVGLGDKAKRLPGQISGGQRQRVAIARALVNRPSLILADEPTGNLDSANGAEIMAIFDELHAEGNTILVVTHERYIAEHAQREIALRDGRIDFGEDPPTPD